MRKVRPIVIVIQEATPLQLKLLFPLREPKLEVGSLLGQVSLYVHLGNDSLLGLIFVHFARLLIVGIGLTLDRLLDFIIDLHLGQSLLPPLHYLLLAHCF